MKIDLIKSILIFVICLALFSNVYAQDSLESISDADKINVYFFWAEGCPHCADEKIFLNELEKNNPDIIIHTLEVTKNRENAELIQKVGKELNADISGVPFTVIGKQYFVGWYNEETTGKAIENAVQCVRENHCADFVSGLVTPITQKDQPLGQKTIPEKLNLPFIGELETKDVSLPVLTIFIAALDGFNPCAMWVLFFLITLLFGIPDIKKRWIFGTVFIAASAIVYFIFMSAWLNLFLFIGFIFWVRLAVGGVAFWAAYYNLKEYVTNPGGSCKVTGEKKRQKVFESLKKIVHEKHFVFAIFALIALAFAVNLVELICSAGLPAVYTQILAMSNLSSWLYYTYLVLYILIFMLDDLFVFFVAMKTMELTGISAKYSRITHLVGGIVMLIIGILMIFKPEMLMFG